MAGVATPEKLAMPVADTRRGVRAAGKPRKTLGEILAERKKYAAEMKPYKDALKQARSAFAKEVRESKDKKAAPESFKTFSAYEQALDNYLTFVMRTQGLQQAEIARQGEVSLLGALWRAEHRYAWGALVAALGGVVIVAPARAVLGFLFGWMVGNPIVKKGFDVLNKKGNKDIAESKKDAAHGIQAGKTFKQVTGTKNLLEKNLPGKASAISKRIRGEKVARLIFSLGTAFASLEVFGASVGGAILEHLGAFGNWLSHASLGDLLGSLFGVAPAEAHTLLQAEIRIQGPSFHFHPYGHYPHGYYGPQHGYEYPYGAQGAPQYEGYGTPQPLHAGDHIIKQEWRIIGGQRVLVTTWSHAEHVVTPEHPAPGPHAAEAQVTETRQVLPVEKVSHTLHALGSDPFAHSRAEAFSNEHIAKLIEQLRAAGKSPAYLAALEKSLHEQASQAFDPAGSDASAIGPDTKFDYMASGKDIMSNGVELKTGAVGSHHFTSYIAERWTFRYTDASGNVHEITMVRPDECNNIAQERDEIITTHTVETPVPKDCLPTDALNASPEVLRAHLDQLGGIDHVKEVLKTLGNPSIHQLLDGQYMNHYLEALKAKGFSHADVEPIRNFVHQYAHSLVANADEYDHKPLLEVLGDKGLDK